ncbi:MAG: hypothetical protein ABMA13_19930 [Chthoniobacteraceae bacterium]
MKALAFLPAMLAIAVAQDAPVVRATTRVLADGSRATTITDLEERTATETVTDAGGKLMRKTIFTLDASGASTGAIHYDAKNNIRYKESYKRDGAGQISASYLYSKDDRLLGHRVFQYDGKGAVAQIDDYDAAGKLIPKAATPAPGKKRR